MLRKVVSSLFLVLLVCSASGQDVYQFTVHIANVSTATTLQPTDGSMQPVPLSPGVWAVHTAPGALFDPGQPDRGDGLEAIAEDGNPGSLAAVIKTQAGIVRSAVFNTPQGAAMPGPLLPGGVYEFSFNAGTGSSVSFATMFVPSNDLFFGPDEQGIALFDAAGQPVAGDLTGEIMLWDSGTEENEEPGVGPNQVQRQSGPNTGPADSDNTVRLVNDGFTYPEVSDVIQVVITAKPVTPFWVRIENVSEAGTLQPSDGSQQFVPLSPGVWAVHQATAPLFNAGQPDRGDGLEAIAEDGSPGQLAENLVGQTGINSSDLFNTPDGAAGPGPLLPGDAYEFTIYAAPGAYFSVATMFIPSNDLFLAPAAQGIPLFKSGDQPAGGNFTSYLDLWDAGTEENEEPGVGPNQAQRQTGPDTGPLDPDNRVRLVNDGFTYPDVADVIRLTINPVIPVPFTVRIENVSSATALMPSDGSEQPVPQSPGVWAVHNSSGPLFRSGQPDRGAGLEAIAEDGNPAGLATVLASQSGILASAVFNTPVGAGGPGPLLPGDAYEFSFEAYPGSYLSFANMFVPSNDLFFGPDEMGIPLFDEDCNPSTGDVTQYILLWDAGTEINEEPGVGPNQVQRQSGPNTGPPDPNNFVRLADDEFPLPAIADLIRVTINPPLEATWSFGEGSGTDFSGVTSDAHIDEHKDDFNTGDHQFLRIGNDGILKSGSRPDRALIKFDFVDALKAAGVPDADAISDAWIEVRVASSEGADADGITVDAFRLLKQWNEGATEYGTAASGEVTWNSARHKDAAWSVAGAGDAGTDREAVADDSQVISGRGRVRFNVLSAVRSIFAGGGNYGWLLQDRDESKDKYYRLYSSEHRNEARRPKLVVVANVPALPKSSVTANALSETNDSAPRTFTLAQNYPNPFNPETSINYSITAGGNVSLTIYNALGQKIRTLVNGVQAGGDYQVTWNGRDDRGVQVSTGLYFYRLTTGGFSSIRKMTFLK